MKLFPWLLSLAFGVVCFASWAMAEIMVRSFDGSEGAAPAFTRLILLPRDGWLLFAPLPWFLYAAVLTFRKETTASAVFIFAGALSLFAAVILCAVAIALALPMIPFHFHA